MDSPTSTPRPCNTTPPVRTEQTTTTRLQLHDGIGVIMDGPTCTLIHIIIFKAYTYKDSTKGFRDALQGAAFERGSQRTLFDAGFLFMAPFTITRVSRISRSMRGSTPGRTAGGAKATPLGEMMSREGDRPSRSVCSGRPN